MAISQVDLPDWKVAAQQKRESINNLIPSNWKLPKSLPPPEQLKDCTDGYIQQFLSKREIEITESDAVEIVKKTSSGKWRAVEVAEAFCHRAALAHQMVHQFL